MSLYDLEQQLAFARRMGAEDYDPVCVDQPCKTLYVAGADRNTVLETDVHSEEFHPARLQLERNGRREIWLR